MFHPYTDLSLFCCKSRQPRLSINSSRRCSRDENARERSWQFWPWTVLLFCYQMSYWNFGSAVWTYLRIYVQHVNKNMCNNDNMPHYAGRSATVPFGKRLLHSFLHQLKRFWTSHGSEHYVLSPQFDIPHTKSLRLRAKTMSTDAWHIFFKSWRVLISPKLSRNVTNNPWTYDSKDSHNFNKNVVVWCFNVGNIPFL